MSKPRRKALKRLPDNLPEIIAEGIKGIHAAPSDIRFDDDEALDAAPEGAGNIRFSGRGDPEGVMDPDYENPRFPGARGGIDVTDARYGYKNLHDFPFGDRESRARGRRSKQRMTDVAQRVADAGGLEDSDTLRPESRRRAEKAISEAIKNMLEGKVKLGIVGELEVPDQSHTAQQQIEGLYEAFALDFVDSPFYDSVTGAFRKIHSYKYVNHPTFKPSLEGELKSMGVPMEEIKKALDKIDTLVEGQGADNPNERDAGWNTNLGDILDMTRKANTRTPKHEEPYNTDPDTI